MSFETQAPISAIPKEIAATTTSAIPVEEKPKTTRQDPVYDMGNGVGIMRRGNNIEIHIDGEARVFRFEDFVKAIVSTRTNGGSPEVRSIIDWTLTENQEWIDHLAKHLDTLREMYSVPV